MASFIVSMERTQKRSSDPKTLADQIRYVTERGTAGARSIWECNDIDGLENPKRVGGDYIYKARAQFERRGRRAVSDPLKLTAEMQEIVKYMKRAATSMKWRVGAATPDWPLPRPNVREPGIEEQVEEGQEPPGKEKDKSEPDFIDFEKPLTFA